MTIQVVYITSTDEQFKDSKFYLINIKYQYAIINKN